MDNTRQRLITDCDSMPKKFFKRFAPSSDSIKNNRSLGFLGSALHHPNLWHFNRRNIAVAFGIGFFCMWIPFPTQTVIAACIAIILKANLPLSVALVFITNPITIPPMFYGAYKLGAVLLHQDMISENFTMSFEWLTEVMHQIWQPLLLGCFIIAVISSLIGYYGIQLLWRLHIVQKLKSRKYKS